MGLRQGVTVAEENKLKQLIAAGKSWNDVLELCKPGDRHPLLDGVDLKTVKKAFWEPLVAKHEAAKKAGYAGILEHERAIAAKKKAEAEKAAADAAKK